MDTYSSTSSDDDDKCTALSMKRLKSLIKDQIKESAADSSYKFSIKGTKTENADVVNDEDIHWEPQPICRKTQETEFEYLMHPDTEIEKQMPSFLWQPTSDNQHCSKKNLEVQEMNYFKYENKIFDQKVPNVCKSSTETNETQNHNLTCFNERQITSYFNKTSINEKVEQKMPSFLWQPDEDTYSLQNCNKKQKQFTHFQTFMCSSDENFSGESPVMPDFLWQPMPIDHENNSIGHGNNGESKLSYEHETLSCNTRHEHAEEQCLIINSLDNLVYAEKTYENFKFFQYVPKSSKKIPQQVSAPKTVKLLSQSTNRVKINSLPSAPVISIDLYNDYTKREMEKIDQRNNKLVKNFVTTALIKKQELLAKSSIEANRAKMKIYRLHRLTGHEPCSVYFKQRIDNANMGKIQLSNCPRPIPKYRIPGTILTDPRKKVVPRSDIPLSQLIDVSLLLESTGNCDSLQSETSIQSSENTIDSSNISASISEQSCEHESKKTQATTHATNDNISYSIPARCDQRIEKISYTSDNSSTAHTIDSVKKKEHNKKSIIIEKTDDSVFPPAPPLHKRKRDDKIQKAQLNNKCEKSDNSLIVSDPCSIAFQNQTSKCNAKYQQENVLRVSKLDSACNASEMVPSEYQHVALQKSSNLKLKKKQAVKQQNVVSGSLKRKQEIPVKKIAREGKRTVRYHDFRIPVEPVVVLSNCMTLISYRNLWTLCPQKPRNDIIKTSVSGMEIDGLSVKSMDLECRNDTSGNNLSLPSFKSAFFNFCNVLK